MSNIGKTHGPKLGRPRPVASYGAGQYLTDYFTEYFLQDRPLMTRGWIHYRAGSALQIIFAPTQQNLSATDTQ